MLIVVDPSSAQPLADLAAEGGRLRLREAAEVVAGAVRHLGASEEEALDAVRSALAGR
ncbi:hypothetical protein [Microbispora bryophytorum]|uniref:hypothetical protein n=1 Tax=Microbispora bryophytorum TaxID=1460882 RepID=UPI0033F4A21C